uniref:FHA domain-containing protein n=1 Tax=Anopheles minimus TaxID=112268 RepID=A0A182WNA5_9DIPT
MMGDGCLNVKKVFILFFTFVSRPRSEDSTMHNNDGYVDKGRSNRNSLHEQQNSRTSKSNTHRYDNRDATGDQGNRNENHHSRTYNKHGSNQQYERDSDNRSIQQASGSRDNEKKSSSCDPEHHVYQTNQNLKGERCNQSTADKYYTSNRKRRYGESPYKQPSGRETSAQKQNNVERQNMGKAHVKEEKNSRYDEETEHTWGRRPDSRSKTFKANDNDKPNSESAVASDKTDSPVEKEKPNFGLSGKLTEEANKVNGVVIAYSEPPGARKPKRRWRLYPFKGDQALPTLYIHRQSCYLIGRDRRICDLPVDHPSCSKQHAVLQYRLVPYERNDGTKSQCVRPYIIDLESSNGTFVNNKKIESKRYLELREKDVLKFGFSSREYVLLHENSKEDNEEDEGLDASPVSKTPNDPTHLSKEETK